MDIFSYQSARRMGDQNVLHKVDALMDWSAILEMLKNGLKRSGLGPQGYKEIILFKCLLIGQWHNLSDPKLEQSLRVRFDFMLFSGLDLYGSVPDETTHCRFRNALVNRQIENHRLKVKEAAATIIDATLIFHKSGLKPPTSVGKGPTVRRRRSKPLIPSTLVGGGSVKAQLSHVHMLRPRLRIAPKMKPLMSLQLLSLVPTTMPDGSRKAARAR